MARDGRLKADGATRRGLSAGPVVEGVTAGGARAWLGLPFAAPPTGPLRWRAPRPAQPWTDERLATQHGERAAQVTNSWDAADGYVPGTVIGSEDCLYLDVYVPPGADGRGCPSWSGSTGAARSGDGLRATIRPPSSCARMSSW